MPRYLVSGEMTISVHVYVDAKDKEEAMQKAEEASSQSFCHQCARGTEDEWTTSGELDGTPENLKVVEDDDDIEM